MRTIFSRYILPIFVLIFSSQAFAANTNPIVNRLVGTASIRGGNILQVGDEVPWGSRVILGAGGEIAVVAKGDFAAKAWGPAELKIRKTTKTKSTWLSLLYGRLITAFQHGKGAAVSTPTSVAGVRGTVVYVEDGPELQDYHCTCEGTVDHRHLKDVNVKRTVHSTHHDQPLLMKKGQLELAKMLNHNDDDVNESI